jgi:DNA-binding transcriptional regulator YiaG
MYSNPSILRDQLLPAADTAGPPTTYAARAIREQIEDAERVQRERIAQASELNTPEMRIRAWERLHRLTLPRGPAHAVLDIIAKATRLTLEQVREEQQRRTGRPMDSGESAAPPQPAPADPSEASSASGT